MLSLPKISRRDINRFLIVNCLRKNCRLSRIELSRQLGLTAAAITYIVSDLIKEGFVRECGLGTSSRGRKPTYLELNSSAAYAIGVDLTRFDRIDASIVNLDCQPLWSAERPMLETRPAAMVTGIEAVVDDLVAMSGIPRHAIFGVGVCLPDIVDHESGIVLGAYNPDWVGVKLGEQIQQVLGLRTYVDNDANIAALGEYWYGDLEERQDFVYVAVAHGVGSGIITGGQVYRGANGSASQFGHIIIQSDDGPRCRCGARGCLEALASEPAILAWVTCQLQAGRTSCMQSPPQQPRELYDAANAGDPLACEAIRVMGHYLGIGITNIINLLNPKAVIIGGRVWRVIDLLLDEVRRTVVANAATIKGRQTSIVSSSLGATTGIVGAATLVLEEVFRVPVFEASVNTAGYQ
jgi:glucokinase-like ROK family protein